MKNHNHPTDRGGVRTLGCNVSKNLCPSILNHQGDKRGDEGIERC